MGLIVDKMENTTIFLGNYFNYHFKRIWNVDIIDDYIFILEKDDVESNDSFQQILKSRVKNFNYFSLVGIAVNTKYVFFRDDIDNDFWGEEGTEHYFLVSEFDFDRDECLIVDTYNTTKLKDGVVCSKVRISQLLETIKKDLKNSWIMDNDSIIALLKNGCSEKQFFVKKNIQSLLFQAHHRIIPDGEAFISPLLWMLKNIRSQKSEVIWTDWLNPRLNVLQTISLHRFFIGDFFSEYVSKFEKVDVKPVMAVIERLDLKISSLKYLSYKLNVTNNGKIIDKIKGEIREGFEEMNRMEIEFSKELLNMFGE